MKWQADWQQTKSHLTKWWNHQGLVLRIDVPPGKPAGSLPPPRRPDDPTAFQTDIAYRVQAFIYELGRATFVADNYPQFLPMLGPGSLSTFLGATPQFSWETVWYEPCIADPDQHGPIRFDPANNRWWDFHLALIDEALRQANGRYMVGMPDLIENMDTLASLRGSEQLLMDLIERPDWVHRSLEQINEAFFASFDRLYERIRFDGGNSFVFDIWGPGKTAKVQCDLSCMLSPAMFREFVVPSLEAQCRWLDYSMYHLDGETALHLVDELLAVESLDAVEWTPMGLSVDDPARPHGGSPKWYDLYRRIKRAGKSVQAIGVKEHEVLPLIDAVGPEGLYIGAAAPDLAAAERLAQSVRQYQ